MPATVAYTRTGTTGAPHLPRTRRQMSGMIERVGQACGWFVGGPTGSVRVRTRRRDAIGRPDRVVAPGYLEKGGPEARGQPEHHAKRQIDLATLARPDVVAMQSRTKRQLLLRDAAICAELTKHTPERNVLGRLRGSHPPKLSASHSIRLPHIYGGSVGSGNPCDL